MMAAVSSSINSPTLFSTCSIDTLNNFYASGSDSCLFNSPTQSVSDPQCGNGIKEGDEACDCGSVEECDNTCCDAATCQLAVGAECSGGECCDSDCLLRPYGTVCRESSGECDIREYCIGDSNECPEDDHMRDGVECNSDTGYCFQGSCPTLADQCMAAFGM